MFFIRVISHLLPGYEHSDFHSGQIAFSKNQFCLFRLLLLPRGWFHATDTIQQMPSATAACRHLPSAAGSWIVTTGGRGWRKASPTLLKGFRPLEPATPGKLSQGR